MGKLQITTAEIKTRILRVCHVPYTLVRVGYNIR